MQYLSIEKYVNNVITTITNDDLLFTEDANWVMNTNPLVAEKRSIKGNFSNILTIYNKDGNVWSKSALGTRTIKYDLPKKGALHKHDFVEIFYVIDGSFDQLLLGNREHFVKGEFVITDQSCEHSDLIEPVDAAVLFLQLSPEYLDLILQSIGSENSLYKFLFHALKVQKKEQSFLRLTPNNNCDDSPIKHILMNIFDEELNRQQGYELILQGLLLRLISILCTGYTPTMLTDSRDSKEKALLYEVERYIRTNLATVTASDLEKNFNYNRNYFNDLIKKYRDMTLKTYIIDVRLTYAKELLNTTSLPVKHIAQIVGYENTSHFYHLFESKFGNKPR